MANSGAVSLWFLRFVSVFLFGVWAQVASASSDELVDKASSRDVSPQTLELYVVPLTNDQLSELATVWQGHMSDVMAEFVDLNLKLETLTGSAAETARMAVANTSEEQARVAKNYRTILANWAAKGGAVDDITPHQKFLTAMSSATLQASDARTMVAIVLGWMGSRDGGIGLLMQLSVFVIAFVVLLFIARFVRGIVARSLHRLPAMSLLLQNFVLTVVYWFTVFIGLMVALGIAGVNVTPLFAVFGGLSFIIGFALQDTLGNLASGLMIMVLKPFDTGDFIEVSGASGVVDDMSVVSTQIRTFDNQIIVVPNSKIWGDVITNVSAAKTRRVDLVFGIAYSDSAPEALEVLKSLVAADKRCLTDPEPAIFVGELGDSSVNLFCRPWVKTDDYWDVYWDLTGQVKERFDAEGISIPFPQRDVHLISVEN
ncbi:mechanosensitive ion channel family protein [Shimia haliotis]|uniref:Small-conductance mechanosensitive channel n=1 Tax=Shimia haliotis TaxID=1280847 RepID=A0A1I4CII9_9RHOB|nr:mechanosensitive ion channel family protein [Shimia haliotis]SFK81054.1 small conductance mechanosensitive channel [Shimia haliotis]